MKKLRNSRRTVKYFLCGRCCSQLKQYLDLNIIDGSVFFGMRKTRYFFNISVFFFEFIHGSEIKGTHWAGIHALIHRELNFS